MRGTGSPLLTLFQPRFLAAKRRFLERGLGGVALPRADITDAPLSNGLGEKSLQKSRLLPSLLGRQKIHRRPEPTKNPTTLNLDRALTLLIIVCGV